jgi:hypothetical protein
MTRNRLYPCPLDPILDHPDFVALPAAGAGMVLRLCGHAWQTAMRPLPDADHELRAISRAHLATWSAHKAEVLRVYEAWRPAAEAYYRQREGAARGLKIAARNGGAANAARLRRRALEWPPTPPRGPTVPQTDTWRAQERAVRQAAASAKPDRTLLT